MKTQHTKNGVKLGGAVRRLNKKTRCILAAAGAVLLVAAIALALVFGGEPKTGDPAAQPDATGPAVDSGEKLDDCAPFVSAQLKAAQEGNPDVVGWLTVEGCEIDDPVVQGADNDVYLRRTVESAEYDIWGCYFLDYINAVDETSVSDRVSIIYGHALDDAADSEKFSKLKRYKDAAFAAAHPTVRFSTLYQELEWEIFAACDIPITVDYIDPNPDDAKYRDTLAYMREHSYADFGVEVGTGDQILVLSTCTSDENVRFVVAAKLKDPAHT